jgi:hypothetical protein
MSNTMKPMPNSPTFSAITSTIAGDPLAFDILRFLMANEKAMDTARGIATWWVHNDEVAVLPSLQNLFRCGAITAHPLRSGTTLYGLTADAEVRVWLRSFLSAAGEQLASARATTRPAQSATPVLKP